MIELDRTDVDAAIKALGMVLAGLDDEIPDTHDARKRLEGMRRALERLLTAVVKAPDFVSISPSIEDLGYTLAAIRLSLDSFYREMGDETLSAMRRFVERSEAWERSLKQ